MTIQQFLASYYCKCIIEERNNNLVITSQAIRRRDNTIIDAVKSNIDIQSTNDWIIDSNSPMSLSPWTWDRFIDDTKRAHLDYFAQRAPIDNYYPLNRIATPNIDNMYT